MASLVGCRPAASRRAALREASRRVAATSARGRATTGLHPSLRWRWLGLRSFPVPELLPYPVVLAQQEGSAWSEGPDSLPTTSGRRPRVRSMAYAAASSIPRSYFFNQLDEVPWPFCPSCYTRHSGISSPWMCGERTLRNGDCHESEGLKVFVRDMTPCLGLLRRQGIDL